MQDKALYAVLVSVAQQCESALSIHTPLPSEPPSHFPAIPTVWGITSTVLGSLCYTQLPAYLGCKETEIGSENQGTESPLFPLKLCHLSPYEYLLSV